MRFLTVKNKIIILLLMPMIVFAVSARPVSAAGIKLTEPLPGQTGAIKEVSGLADYLVKIYNLGLILAGVLAMAGIMIGGFLYMTSSYSGNLGKMADGKSIITSSLLGLGVALLSYLLIYTIDPRLTHPKDVFLEIPAGACQGGIANISDEDTCKELCGIGSGGEERYKVSYDENKCCKCEDAPQTCIGNNAYSNIYLRSDCKQKCENDCPTGYTCRIQDHSTETGCCKCLRTQFEDTDTTCAGGTKLLVDSIQRDCYDLCCPYGSSGPNGNTDCGVASWEVNTGCCKCKK